MVFLLKYGESLEGKPVQVQRVLDSRRIVGWRFLGITSLASIVVFAVLPASSVPRIGFTPRASRLGNVGFDAGRTRTLWAIKENSTVVMRVEFDNPEARTSLRPTGAAFHLTIMMGADGQVSESNQTGTSTTQASGEPR